MNSAAAIAAGCATVRLHGARDAGRLGSRFRLVQVRLEMTALRNTGNLYVVATPIGNLEDITARAARVLQSVEILACEDTRRCRILLRHLGANPTELISLHDHNESAATRRVLARLASGRDVALVSDAGTPLVSDPGFELVREAHRAGVAVTPVPGPSALTAALSASPLPAGRFFFEGFLPARGGPRRQALSQLLRRRATTVFFEAPHRVARTLADLDELGAGERRITLCRELTKAFETIVHGAVTEVAQRVGPLKGEFVCVLEGSREAAAGDSEGVLTTLLEELPPAQAARLTARLTGESRTRLYRLAARRRDMVESRAGQAAATPSGVEESPGSSEQGAR